MTGRVTSLRYERRPGTIYSLLASPGADRYPAFFPSAIDLHLNIRLIAPEPVRSRVRLTRPSVREHDAGVVPACTVSANQGRTVKVLDAPQARLLDELGRNATLVKCFDVGGC